MDGAITIQTSAGVCQAWEFTPSQEGKFPGVLLYMDAIGIRPSLLALAQRIASEGFFVFVPNLFYRFHPVPLVKYPARFNRHELSHDVFPTVMPWVYALTPEFLLEDARAYLNHLQQHPRVRHGKVHMVGYCFGGGHAVRTAAKYPDEIASVVSLHAGRLYTDEPESPHRVLSEVRAKLYFGHADHDQSMFLPMIQDLEALLLKLGKDAVSDIYTDARHGFTQKDLPAYDEEASEKSFKKTIETFKSVES